MALFLIQSCLPHYRQGVLAEMCAQAGSDFRILTGPDHFDPSLRTELSLGDVVVEINNHYVFGRRLLWQSGCVLAGIRAENVILELNPRILNVWAILLGRRALGRRTAIWGHAWPKAGKASRRDMARNALRRLAHTVVVYTQTQADEVRARNPQALVVAAPNAMYSINEPGPAAFRDVPHRFVYSGRLVDVKKVDLLLDAFALAGETLGSDASLTIIGDGPRRDALEEQARGLDIADRVEFLGHEADPRRLRTLYAEAVASVSPGGVGLALTQSLWFGVPMIVADDEIHGPEIEVAREGDTAFFFPAGDQKALAERLAALWQMRSELPARRESLSEDCRANYSIEVMAERLVCAAN